MTEREVQMARKRLCSAAMAGKGEYHPNVCQKCKSPCKYGTRLLHYYGIPRLEQKETPTERSSLTSSRQMRYRLKGYNRYSVIR